jgi:methionyl aminopeptidase
MWAGIKAVAPGARVGDIGAAVQAVGDRHGYGIVQEYVGHGIGLNMHEKPNVPNFGKAGSGMKLREGMAICIEPMFNLGTHQTFVEDDEWTVKTADGSLSAHWEHTVALTEEGVKVLTAQPELRADLWGSD